MAASIVRQFTFSFVMTAKPTIRKMNQERLFSVSKCATAYLFTYKHEWILINREGATVGISKYAQSLCLSCLTPSGSAQLEELGDIVYVEISEVGTKLEANDLVGCIESTKSVSEIFSPIGGTITEVNRQLLEKPGLVNTSPLGDGWLYKLSLSPEAKTERLMSEEAYTIYIDRLGEQ